MSLTWNVTSFAIIILLLSTGLSSQHVHAKLIVTYLVAESGKDTRREYNNQLLALALDKTVVTHGSYQLVPSKPMNLKRAMEEIVKGKLVNFLVKLSANKDDLSRFGYVNFPVDLGIVGYRAFFVSPKSLDAFKKIQNLNELKAFSIVQGLGWLDTKILRNSGFKVIEGTSYEGLFNMVAKSRVDLFPRGVNEIYYEHQQRIDNIQLIPDASIVLYYPLPRFFFTHKNNAAAIERIQTGLEIAYKDGSLKALWYKYYHQSLDFVALKKSKILRIENPFIKGINPNYQQYIYAPDLVK